jgi:hypothetical protein
MSIRPVKELPARAGFGVKGSSYVAADLREFVRKGMDVAVIDVEGKKPAQIVVACKKYVEAHPEQYRGVKAGVRGGRAYVWREDPR